MIMKRFLYYIWFLPLMLSGCEKDLMYGHEIEMYIVE